MLQLPLIRKMKLLMVILTGPILVFSILFAINNLLITYEKTERIERRTIWSLVQVGRETRRTLYDGNLYLNGKLSSKAFQTQYEVLWSRIPISLTHLENDEADYIAAVTALEEGIVAPIVAIKQLFELIQSAETAILSTTAPDHEYLSHWLMQLNASADFVTKTTMHNIIDDDSDYSEAISKTLLGALLWVGATVLVFFGYITLLVRILWQEYLNIQYLMQHDTLTGLASRDFTIKMLEKYTSAQQNFTIITFDLNKFKAINDTFGHQVGDSVLMHLAAMFEQALCDADNVVGRMGGDEFIWISPNTDQRYIEKQYAIFLQSLETPYRLNQKHLKLHLSAGGGFAADFDFNINRILEQVDAAMYEAKQQKLTSIQWCNSGNTKHSSNNTKYNNNKKNEPETTLMEYMIG